MATRKKTNKKTATKTNKKINKTTKEENPVTEKKVQKFMEEQRLTVSVGTSSDYGKVKVSLALSKNLKEGDDPTKAADEVFEILAEKLDAQYELLHDKLGIEDEPEDEYEDDDSDDEEYEEDDSDDEEYEDDDSDDGDDDDDDSDADDDDEEDEDEDCDDITEEAILKMTKKECGQLIKDEGLDLKLKDYKKVGELRNAIIDELFVDEDDEDGEDTEWDDDEWDDEDDE